jgi:predicted TIM-barrel fold metal-dependent hydrolase
MIIDFHQHPYPGVHELMQQNHITVSVLLPGPGGNETVLQWARQWPGQFIPFYWVDLADPPKAAGQLEVAVKQHGHRGIKFQPLVQRFYPNESRLRPIFAKASQLGIPVLFHAGVVAFANHDAQYGTCIYIDELASEFPDLNIVIAHMGGNYHFEALVIAEKHPNVYLDTAYLPFFCGRSLPAVRPIDLIKRAIEFAGPHKILYAYEGTRPAVILDSDIREEHKKLILWQNAKRLLNLPEPQWIGAQIEPASG